MKPILKELTRYGKLLVEKGLTTGPGGNISARDGNTIHLSPSGYSLAEIGPDDWVSLDLKSGRRVGRDNGLRPTCEVSMHLACYLSRPEIRTVVHTHPVTATAVATAGVKFKALFPDFVALLGREVPAVDFVTPGGEEIRAAVAGKVKQGHNVVLLKNHGAVALGVTLKEAYFRSLLLENAAAFLLAILAAGGRPRYLTPKEIRSIECLEAEDYRKLLLQKGV
ncbi:MAG TPA: class II aldolase/adducin family protein [bacterium]|nr:class II aldolase/adducin family protein [bacterium]